MQEGSGSKKQIQRRFYCVKWSAREYVSNTIDDCNTEIEDASVISPFRQWHQNIERLECFLKW